MLDSKSYSNTASAFLLRVKPLAASTIEKREIRANEVKGLRYSVKYAASKEPVMPPKHRKVHCRVYKC